MIPCTIANTSVHYLSMLIPLSTFEFSRGNGPQIRPRIIQMLQCTPQGRKAHKQSRTKKRCLPIRGAFWHVARCASTEIPAPNVCELPVLREHG